MFFMFGSCDSVLPDRTTEACTVTVKPRREVQQKGVEPNDFLLALVAEKQYERSFLARREL